jgi:medium-chain acyl-[acyl-carrier-protein] hydrolase
MDTRTRWLAFHEPQPTVRLRLFCLPYAGGGATLFRGWQQQVGPGIEICPIELPGRGQRRHDPPFRRVADAVHAICMGVEPYLVGVPCAWFGHSMGAILAFEIARRLQLHRGVRVRHLFVSATRAPHRHHVDRHTYNVPDDEFIEILRGLKGTSEALLTDLDAMELMLPHVRADVELVQTYHYAAGARVRCPVRAFAGLDDAHVSREDMEQWREAVSGPFALSVIPGDHFFLTAAARDLLGVIGNDLHAC